MANINIILNTIIAIITLSLGAVVFSRDSKRPAYIYFFLATVFAFCWILSNAIFPYANANISLVLGRISFTSAVLLLYFLYLFIRNFPNENKNKLNPAILAVPIGLCVILSWTQVLVKGIVIRENYPNIEYGILYPFYAGILFIFIAIINFILIGKMMRSEGQLRLQLLLICIGF